MRPRITDRGIVFSADALLACLCIASMLFSLYVFSASFFGEASRSSDFSSRLLFASALSEAIVSSRDEAFPCRGAAFYNPSLRRAEKNRADVSLLERMSPCDFGDYSLVALYRRDASGKKYYFGSDNAGCLAIERFVVFGAFPGSRGVLGAVVCEN